MAICNDKWKTHGFLAEHGLSVPGTWLDWKEAASAAREGRARYPMIIKPRWGMGSLGIFGADGEEERILADKCRRGISASYLKIRGGPGPERLCVDSGKAGRAGVRPGRD